MHSAGVRMVSLSSKSDDPMYPNSGALWDVNESGDAVGRVVRITGPGLKDAIVETLVVHCHKETPTVTILPRPATSGASDAYGDR